MKDGQGRESFLQIAFVQRVPLHGTSSGVDSKIRNAFRIQGSAHAFLSSGRLLIETAVEGHFKFRK